jgi:hypothetical protein
MTVNLGSKFLCPPSSDRNCDKNRYFLSHLRSSSAQNAHLTGLICASNLEDVVGSFAPTLLCRFSNLRAMHEKEFLTGRYACRVLPEIDLKCGAAEKELGYRRPDLVCQDDPDQIAIPLDWPWRDIRTLN